MTLLCVPRPCPLPNTPLRDLLSSPSPRPSSDALIPGELGTAGPFALNFLPEKRPSLQKPAHISSERLPSLPSAEWRMSILGQLRAGFRFISQLLLPFPVVEGQASRPALVSQVGSFYLFLPLSTSLTEHADESVWGVGGLFCRRDLGTLRGIGGCDHQLGTVMPRSRAPCSEDWSPLSASVATECVLNWRNPWEATRGLGRHVKGLVLSTRERALCFLEMGPEHSWSRYHPVNITCHRVYTN